MYKKTVLTILTVLGMGTLSAMIHPKPCDWVFDAEFLYLLPSVDDTYFAIQGSSNGFRPDGDRINNDFRFKPGFRVGAFFGIDCGEELQIYYTRFCENRNKTVAGNNLWATVGSVTFGENFASYTGTAASASGLTYQQAEALFAYEICGNCPFHAYLQGGLDYSYVRLRENDTYTDTTGPAVGTIDRCMRMWGIGPEFGFEIDYDICQCSFLPGRLSFIGGWKGALLASQSNQQETDILNGDLIYHSQDQKTWRVVPTMHTKLGLNYLFCGRCFSAALEVGYEFTSYFRGITRLLVPDDVSLSTTANQYTNFDLQGLYVALNIGF